MTNNVSRYLVWSLVIAIQVSSLPNLKATNREIGIDDYPLIVRTFPSPEYLPSLQFEMLGLNEDNTPLPILPKDILSLVYYFILDQTNVNNNFSSVFSLVCKEWSDVAHEQTTRVIIHSEQNLNAIRDKFKNLKECTTIYHFPPAVCFERLIDEAGYRGQLQGKLTCNGLVHNFRHEASQRVTYLEKISVPTLPSNNKFEFNIIAYYNSQAGGASLQLLSTDNFENAEDCRSQIIIPPDMVSSEEGGLIYTSYPVNNDPTRISLHITRLVKKDPTQ